MLGPDQLQDFERRGYAAVRGAFSRATAEACQAEIWSQLEEQGVHRGDRATWTRPVVRINTPWTEPFWEAGRSPALHEAYDQLVGPGRWQHTEAVGGTVPVRFPSADDPGDAGWHIDGSFGGAPDWLVNVRSRGRALLCLFLFTDVGPDDAPTRLLEGSHLDVPPLLLPFGEEGVAFHGFSLAARTFDRREARATGQAGDVFVCHPFLVHAASWPHRGRRARMVGQPGVPHEGFDLTDGAFPVERTILAALDR